MEEKLEFVYGDPLDGTPTLGVVYYILNRKEIYEQTGIEPIGYVIDLAEEEAAPPEEVHIDA